MDIYEKISQVSASAASEVAPNICCEHVETIAHNARYEARIRVLLPIKRNISVTVADASGNVYSVTDITRAIREAVRYYQTSGVSG